MLLSKLFKKYINNKQGENRQQQQLKKLSVIEENGKLSLHHQLIKHASSVCD